MKLKSTIAALLTLLFLGKVVSVDAQGYSMLLESNGISLVNQYCDYGFFMDGADEQQDLQEAPQNLSLEIGFLCQTPVQLFLVEWETITKQQNFKKHGYLNPGIFQVYSDRFYPPPRI